MNGKLLNILVCLLIVVRTESSLVDITVVQSAVAKGAVCLDGSPPAYHFDEGSGAGINNWLIHLEGGGWCNNVPTCLDRKTTRLGSSNQMAKQANFSGILSNEQQLNPDFYNWNRVRVRYCDGSSFTGDIEAVDPSTNLHHRGARIFVAVMEELLANGMANSENAILTGCSAGGLASFLHCDDFKSLFPAPAKVKCFADAGFFINTKDVSGAPHIEDFYNGVVTTHGSAKNLPQSCTSRMKPSLCFFPQNSVQGIQTPLFIINSAYDSWQVRNSLIPHSADPRGVWRKCKNNINECSGAELETLQGFRSEFINTLKKGLGNTTTTGYFINSCYAHCQTELQETWFGENSPSLDGQTIAKAVGDWFYDRSSFQRIDCPYPCDKTCQNLIWQMKMLNIISIGLSW